MNKLYLSSRCRQKRGFDYYAAIIIVAVIIVLLLGCEEEPVPEFYTVKLKYPIEGTYKGVYSLSIPGLGYNVTHPNTVVISSINAEQVLVKNMGTSGVASVSSDPSYYYYSPFYWVDVTDCFKEVAITFSTGTGHIAGDSLTEVGQVRVLYKNDTLQGSWSTRSVKY